MSSREMSPMTPVASVGGFRLSPQQRRAWRVGQQGEGPWTVLRVFRVEGEVDPAELERALGRVVARHEILRTTVRRMPGLAMPLQDVLEEVELGLVRHETADGSSQALEAILVRIAEETRRAAEEGRPALRAYWLARAGADPLLVLSAPSLCADRPGLERVVRELAAEVSGEDVLAGEEPVQYADLAEWQNDLVESEEGERERGLWRRLDLDQAIALRLPFETAPPEPGSSSHAPFAPSAVVLDLEPDLAAACRRRSEAAGVAPADLLLACWGLLLGRLTDRPEPVLGVVVEGREYEGLDAVPGPLSKVVPLALPTRDVRSRQQLLERSREALQEVRGIQEYWSWEASGGSGNPGEVPVLPVVFEVRRDPSPIALGAARLVPVREESCFEPFTLRLVVRESAGSLRLEFHHDPRRVDREDARRTLEQLVGIVAGVATGQDRADPVDRIEVLSTAERCLLEDLHRLRPESSQEPLVHRRFTALAARYPERPAVLGEGGSLTYGELHRRAGVWARRLRARGIGPEDRVALCFDRTPEMMVALLAVLEAGAAYVPLDPVLPERRLASMLAISGARCVLTTETLRDTVPAGDADVLYVGPGLPEEDGTGTEEEPPAVDIRPENLAYLLFTSGSTGEPKGVAVEHRQLTAYVDAAVERLGLGGGGTFAIVSTLAADLGNTMVFPALSTGGCLLLVPVGAAADPEVFADWAGAHPFDYLKVVPSHLRALLSGSRPEGVLPRRVLVLGGEALPWELASRVVELTPGVAVFNHYGPTETTIGVLAAPVPAQQGRVATVPMGLPLSHARVHLLDREGRPVPSWVPGEVHVGGNGVARGYLGQPKRTAERFLPDPYGPPGARAYRTGDRARRLPDGSLEFLGRVDGQVKIRGFRVETGEVESLLLRHEGVREAVVAVRREEGAEPRLVAWVVPSGEAIPVPELRAFLAERLPEAMVPAAFVSLKSLPLNPNGKVDRQALPAPDSLRPELAAEYVPPGTEIERAVAAIWQDVLRLERVGLHDNFFDLGGHSLLLVQVAARLRETFDREITMVELFRRTTVAALVAFLKEEGGEKDDDDGAGGRARAETRKDSLQRQRRRRRQRQTGATG